MRKLFIAVVLPCLLVAGCTQPKAPAKPPVIIMSPGLQAGPKVKLETLANKKDPLCHMDLEPEVAFTAEYEGKRYGFCSDYCRKEFEKDPRKALEAKAEPTAMPAAGSK